MQNGYFKLSDPEPTLYKSETLIPILNLESGRIWNQLRVFSCDSAFFTLSDLARIIELSSAQLDRTEIANFAPVSWAMLLNSKEFRSEVQLKYTVLHEALPSGA